MKTCLGFTQDVDPYQAGLIALGGDHLLDQALVDDFAFGIFQSSVSEIKLQKRRVRIHSNLGLASFGFHLYIEKVSLNLYLCFERLLSGGG